MEDGEITEDVEAAKDIEKDDSIMEDPAGDTPTAVNQSDRKPSNHRQTGWSRKEGNQRAAKMVTHEDYLICVFLLHVHADFSLEIEATFFSCSFNCFGAITSILIISFFLSETNILIISLCFQDFEAPVTEHVPRVLPKNDDPSLVNRNKRMLGQLIGTLEVCLYNYLICF